jgi:hypothetical protein
MQRSNLSGPASWAARRVSAATFGLLVILAVAVLGEAASASASLPVSLTYLDATAAFNGLQVRPATIAYTGDGTGFLGGAHARRRGSRIHWTKWTTGIALGTGFNQLNDCVPFCARGTFHAYPVRIELWRPRTIAGTLVFTRLTIFYRNRRPSGAPRHYTFTDTYRGGSGGGYGWGPPDAQGYCVNTYGEPPAPGCKNIHSLP